jgi:hypothetical protein
MAAMIEHGDFELAARYLPEPARWVDYLNAEARALPLFPAEHTAPRLAATLMGYVDEVRQRTAILAGLGRDAAAAEARPSGLAGIASDELRALAARDLDAPGTLLRLVNEWQMRVIPPDAATPDSTPR